MTGAAANQRPPRPVTYSAATASSTGSSAVAPSPSNGSVGHLRPGPLRVGGFVSKVSEVARMLGKHQALIERDILPDRVVLPARQCKCRDTRDSSSGCLSTRLMSVAACPR